MKAVRIHRHGPPEVLTYEDLPDPTPQENEVVIRQSVIGVNFTDVYTRAGLYPANLPLIVGMEGSGVVSEVGHGATGVGVGDLIAYSNVKGAYAEFAVVPLAKMVRIPTGLDPKIATAALVQGVTAHFLTRDTFRLESGHTALIHAGAGGLGGMLVQMAKQAGAYVIATTSTEAKARAAEEAGADRVIVYTSQDFEEEVRTITKGKGVDVVYDSVGKATFEKSLKCLAPRGYLVLCGQSSGMVPPTPPSVLQKGSLFLTRPMMLDYVATHDELDRRANDVFRMVMSGKLKVRIFRTFPLSQAVEAHRMLESRQTIGKLLLIP
jgi:NADPH2:quinone reductase